MIRLAAFAAAILLFTGTHDKFRGDPVCSVFVADSIQTPIHITYDSLGRPDRYEAHIFTPVCETERCYSVEILFYWDLLGRLLRYDTIAGQGLTKLDHIPFTVADYVKLDGILTNQNSPLALYAKEELIKNTRDSELDGFTGATIREIQGAVINGAVYSCYVLWHIANGPVVDSLQKATVNMFDRVLVNKLFDMRTQDINYFLIDNFTEEQFLNYLPKVLESMAYGAGYYVKHTIERLPNEVFGDSLVQDYFADNFNEMNYFTQVALLQKLDRSSLRQSLRNIISASITERDSYRNDLIKELIKRD